ncbi:hypothetical protein ACTFIY_009053 [Dictyostelium cf. discoideum]
MQFIKSSIAYSFASYSKNFINKNFSYLCIEPNKYDEKFSLQELKEIYESLTIDEKYKVETIYWELCKKQDSRIDGLFYGKNHLFENLKFTIRSLHRCNHLNDLDETNNELIKIEFTNRFKRNKTTNSTQYYSLGEKIGKDFEMGQIGYVNGMDNSIGWAGTDASKISESMVEGMNLHCVYLPSYQISPDNYSPSPNDAIGHLTINGGEFSKTSILIAQLWIDYLFDNPDKSFLQICASDGGTFVTNAIKIIIKYSPNLLSRISFLFLAPGCILIPNDFNNNNDDNNIEYSKSNQVLKLEDTLISKFATGANHLNNSKSMENIIIVPHNNKNDHPHNFLNNDYINSVLPFIKNWKETGKLIL